MSLLISHDEAAPERVTAVSAEPHEIARRLAQYGVRFERWPCGAPLPDDATPDRILAAYGADVDRLKREHGYQSADVVRLSGDARDPEWPDKARAARAKFLAEHRHSEDEVRFFVAGSGMFALRLGGSVQLVLCEQGDLLSVPAGTRHWFDMGSNPSFCAIRLFGTPDGWVAEFTGDPIAQRYPSYDQVVARWR